MTTKEVMTQIVNSVQANYKSEVKSNTDQTTDSFQSYMNSNLKTNNDVSRNNDTTNVGRADSKSSDKDEKSTTAKTDKETKAKDNTSTENTSSTEKPSEKDTSTVSEKKTVENTKDECIEENPIQEQISELQGKIKEMLLSELDISDEELENAMATLGLNYLDLFDPSKLSQLFLEVKGIDDISSILTDSGLSDELNELMNSVNSIDLTEFSLTKEDIAKFVDNLNAVEGNPNTKVMPEMNQVNPVNTDETKETLDDEQPKITVEVTKQSESGTSTHDDSPMHEQKQSNDPAISNANLNTIVTNLTNAVVAGDFSEQVMVVEQMRDIVNQVVEQIKVLIKPGETSMEFQLNPENLGKVNLTVTQREGVLTAQFVVQNEMAKEALENQMITLKETLENQGIKVESVEVTVSNFGLSQNGMSDGNSEQQKSSSKRRNINIDEAIEMEEELTEEENLTAQMMVQSGNSIDYSA
jgi:flagellar hook-length control protein FliK